MATIRSLSVAQQIVNRNKSAFFSTLIGTSLLAVSFVRNMITANSGHFQPVTHVIFDLDGTLIDSVTCFHDSLNEVIAKYNVTIPMDLMATILKKPTAYEAVDFLVNKYNLPITAEKYEIEFNRCLNETVKRVNLMPGTMRLLDHFHANNIPMALCTADSSELFAVLTQKHKELFEPGRYFEVIVTAEDDPDVKRNKPFPDPYLVAIQRFKSKPKWNQVLVFEDSTEGVKSAIEAGTQCVQVQDERFYNTSSELATLVIKSLNNFKPELFGLPKYT